MLATKDEPRQHYQAIKILQTRSCKTCKRRTSKTAS